MPLAYRQWCIEQDELRKKQSEKDVPKEEKKEKPKKTPAKKQVAK